ncbi:apoptosis-inducing factor 3-like isoform X2 [Bactrocera tryoni]|uniref:apoptosis-inducing factor 3-like isoform X2 n=1 Tax=Bactrocera tryoni TaxID=59916 RepID=UPI001A98678C|nr:apoptosis-inducing factor 3-like isoform X2 [Bactrocera tryoni]
MYKYLNSLARRCVSILSTQLLVQQQKQQKLLSVFRSQLNNHYQKRSTSNRRFCQSTNKPRKQQQVHTLYKNLKSTSGTSTAVRMGSANCKEYSTTTSKRIEDVAAKPQDGTYQSTTQDNMSEYTSAVEVCNIEDLKDNEMKAFNFDEDTKVLVVKQDGEITAIGNKCPHYGAPLHTGALGHGRVRCPWHGATFNTRTGDIEDFPGLDALPCFMVRVENDGKIKLRAKRTDLEKNKRLKDMVKRDKSNQQCVVVIGGGPAAATCVEALRQEGFSGRIVMLCREPYLPYDRIKLSKGLGIPINTLEYRNADFYAQYGIETLIGVEATKVDTVAKTVQCSNDESIKYDQLFIATGLSARKPPVPGVDLKNVFTLRDYEDSKAILAAVTPETNVVCVGGSFIAMEVAAALVNKAKSVTVIFTSDYPFALFGDAVGKLFYDLYREKGIIMKNQSQLSELYGNAEGFVNQVELNNGNKFDCDVVVLGTGSVYNTGFLENSGIHVNRNGSINTDMHLMTNVIDVYAGGDIANAPVFANANQRESVSHIQLAQYHGRVAGLNIAGNIQDLRAVPFFFSLIFGKGMRYAGHGHFSDVLIKGDLENFKFVAYYLDNYGNVVAVLTIGHDPVVAQFAELLSQGKRLHRSHIENGGNHLNWTHWLDEKKSRTPCEC